MSKTYNDNEHENLHIKSQNIFNINMLNKMNTHPFKLFFIFS